jgi:hypothetical protein
MSHIIPDSNGSHEFQRRGAGWPALDIGSTISWARAECGCDLLLGAHPAPPHAWRFYSVVGFQPQFTATSTSTTPIPAIHLDQDARADPRPT